MTFKIIATGDIIIIVFKIKLEMLKTNAWTQCPLAGFDLVFDKQGCSHCFLPTVRIISRGARRGKIKVSGTIRSVVIYPLKTTHAVLVHSKARGHAVINGTQTEVVGSSKLTAIAVIITVVCFDVNLIGS